MKKFLILVLVVCMMIPCALAEDIDLSGLSFDQLVALQQRISAEIVTRPEWKEVEVPAGQWIVGEDIPVGTYCISAPTQALFRVWKRAVDDYSDRGLYMNEIVKADSPFAKVKLEKGWIVDVNRTVIFSPAKTLGF